MEEELPHLYPVLTTSLHDVFDPEVVQLALDGVQVLSLSDHE